MQIAGCISENKSHQIVGDVHVVNSPGWPYACGMDIKVRDDTLGTFHENANASCDGSDSVSFPAISGHHYHTYGTVYLEDILTLYRWEATIPNSPAQVAG